MWEWVGDGDIKVLGIGDNGSDSQYKKEAEFCNFSFQTFSATLQIMNEYIIAALYRCGIQRDRQIDGYRER